MEDLIEQAARLCEQEGKVVRIPVAPVERVLTLGRLESIDGRASTRSRTGRTGWWDS